MILGSCAGGMVGLVGLGLALVLISAVFGVLRPVRAGFWVVGLDLWYLVGFGLVLGVSVLFSGCRLLRFRCCEWVWLTCVGCCSLCCFFKFLCCCGFGFDIGGFGGGFRVCLLWAW